MDDAETGPADLSSTLRIGAVPGMNPGKWIRIWQERFPRRPISLVVVEQARQREALESGEVSLCFVRDLPIDDALHQIPLYEETPVVVVAKEHVLSVWEEVDADDLRELDFLQRPGEVHGWAGTMASAVAEPVLDEDVPSRLRLVARDLGVMVLPQSVARLHARRDVCAVPVRGLPPTRIGLAWLRALEPSVTEDFIGVVRGRTKNSSRDAPGRAVSRPRASEKPSERRGRRRR